MAEQNTNILQISALRVKWNHRSLKNVFHNFHGSLNREIPTSQIKIFSQDLTHAVYIFLLQNVSLMLLVLQFKALHMHFEAVAAKNVLMQLSGAFQFSIISSADRVLVVAVQKNDDCVSNTNIQGSLALNLVGYLSVAFAFCCLCSCCSLWIFLLFRIQCLWVTLTTESTLISGDKRTYGSFFPLNHMKVAFL